MRTHWRSRQNRRHLHRERSGTGDRRKGLLGLRSSPGSLALLAAIRRASLVLEFLECQGVQVVGSAHPAPC
jgi:hypothetical protein